MTIQYRSLTVAALLLLASVHLQAQVANIPDTSFPVVRSMMNSNFGYLAARVPISCAGTPGNTVGVYLQQCQTAAGAVYACNNPSGCAVAADWVGGGSGGAVSSVFGRTGAVTAQSGDYTTAQVTESGNLYFTNARAVAAMSGMYQTPLTLGTTAQYFRGDLSLATFPTNLSSFTNGPGYLIANQTITISSGCTGSGTTSIALTCAYGSLSGIPASFTPSTHGSTHAGSGSDPLPANMRARGVGYVFDGAGSALSAGRTGYYGVPFACTISAWTITVDTGTATIDVWKVASGTAIPTIGNSITASATPAIASNTVLHSTALTGWTTAVAGNDIIGFNLKIVSGATNASLVLECDQ